LNIISSNNVTMKNMIVGHVPRREEMVMQKMVDKESCVSICAYFNKPDPTCYNNKIQDSIAFGCMYSGFVVPGHDCDASESQDNFRGCVAHSIDGTGATIFPDVTGSSHDKCYEGSHFSAYKNQ
jgi:hypothetical protein